MGLGPRLIRTSAVIEHPDLRSRPTRSAFRRLACELGSKLAWALGGALLLASMVAVLLYVPYGGLALILLLLVAALLVLGARSKAERWRWRRIQLKLEPVLATWRQHLLSTQPTDRELVESAIAEIYARRRRSAPRIEWARSPTAFLQARTQLGERAPLHPPGVTPVHLLPIGREILGAAGWSAWNRVFDHTATDLLDVELRGLVGSCEEDVAMALAACLGGSRLSEVVEQTSWFAFLEDVAVVLERPVEIHVNDALSLHHPARPAVRFADGWTLCALDGVIVPREAIEDPDGFDPRRALHVRNVEQRRVLLEHLGWDRVVRGAGAEPESEDEHGRIWRLPVEGGDEALVLVEVENATPEPDGTRQRYFLRVPPTMRTPREAVAWTFQQDPLEYAPEAAS